jgi:hypothetical protein
MGQPRESDAPPIRGVLGYLPGRFRPVYAILEARPTGNLFCKAGYRGAARLRRFGRSVLSRIHQPEERHTDVLQTTQTNHCPRNRDRSKVPRQG